MLVTTKHSHTRRERPRLLVVPRIGHNSRIGTCAKLQFGLDSLARYTSLRPKLKTASLFEVAFLEAFHAVEPAGRDAMRHRHDQEVETNSERQLAIVVVR